MEQLSLLRSVTQRLVVTPSEELPRISGVLATTLSGCSQLSLDSEQKTIDFSGPLHRLRTRLSSLLQGRTSAERLAAAIVIKAYVEVVRPVESNEWETWGRGLITCLNKADPWEAKAVYLSTLTRLLILCHESATLQREVVSPLLPAFLNASLSAVKPANVKRDNQTVAVPSQLLPDALKSWIELVQHFSQTFRPFLVRLRQVCLALLGEEPAADSLRDSAVRMLSLLNLCSPKATSHTDWEQTAANIILATHQSIDVLFRPVVEDWTSTSAALSQRAVGPSLAGIPKLDEVDAAGLNPWIGSFDGSRRILVLLKWLSRTLATISPTVSLPLGAIVDLMSRLMHVTIPSAVNHIKTRSEIGKDEKDELWSCLPRLHAQVLELIKVMYGVFDKAMRPMDSTIFGLILDVFEVEHWTMEVRKASYEAMLPLLKDDAHFTSQAHVSGYQTMLKAACRDVLNGQGASSLAPTSLVDGASRAKTPLKPALESRAYANNGYLYSSHGRAAQALLLATYENASAHLSHSIRTELDRASVLSNDEDLLLASTMHPPSRAGTSRSLPSLLPFLVRSHEGHNQLSTEALLRPRIPSLHITQTAELQQRYAEADEEAGVDVVMNGVAEAGIDMARTHDAQSDQYAATTAANEEALATDSVKVADYDPHESTRLPTKRKLSHSGVTTSEGPVAEKEVAEAVAKRPRAYADPDHLQSLQTNGSGKQQQSDPISAQQPVVLSYTASDSITIHSAEKPSYNGVTVVPDSDEESDIPEIDTVGDTDDDG